MAHGLIPCPNVCHLVSFPMFLWDASPTTLAIATRWCMAKTSVSSARGTLNWKAMSHKSRVTMEPLTGCPNVNLVLKVLSLHNCLKINKNVSVESFSIGIFHQLSGNTVWTQAQASVSQKNLLKLIIIGIFNELLSLTSLRRLFIRDFQAPCKIHKTKSEGVIEYVFTFSARCKTLPGK